MKNNFELTNSFHELFIQGKLKFVYGSDGGLYLPDVEYNFSFPKGKVLVNVMYKGTCVAELNMSNDRQDFSLCYMPMRIDYDDERMKDTIKKKATEKITNLIEVIKLLDNLK